MSIKTNSPVHCQYSVLRGKSLCFEALHREGKQSRDDQIMRIWLVALKSAYFSYSPWQRKSSPVIVAAHQHLHVVITQLVVERLAENSGEWRKTHTEYTILKRTEITLIFSLILWGVTDLTTAITFLWTWNLRRTWLEKSFVAVFFLTHDASAWTHYK